MDQHFLLDHGREARSGESSQGALKRPQLSRPRPKNLVIGANVSHSHHGENRTRWIVLGQRAREASTTRSSRCTTSRWYSGPRLAASHRVDRPMSAGISAAS